MVQKHLEKMMVGAALAIAATALLPIAGSTLRPLAMNGMQAAIGMMNRAKSAAQKNEKTAR